MEVGRSLTFFHCPLLKLYLVTSTPITAFPYVFPDFSKRIEPFVLPWVFPFVQVSSLEIVYYTVTWHGIDTLHVIHSNFGTNKV